MAEWSKAMVLRNLLKHHYRKMREFEPHCEQLKIYFFMFESCFYGVLLFVYIFSFLFFFANRRGVLSKLGVLFE